MNCLYCNAKCQSSDNIFFKCISCKTQNFNSVTYYSYNSRIISIWFDNAQYKLLHYTTDRVTVLWYKKTKSGIFMETSIVYRYEPIDQIDPIIADKLYNKFMNLRMFL